MCASRFSTCCIAIWATTSTGRRRCSRRWWPRGGWGGRAAAVSMSIAIEATGLSETQRQIVDLAREFARTRIEPHAAEWDRTGYFPRDVLDELGRLGFLGMCTPEAFDGMGLDTLTYFLALEEIAAADASIAISVSIHNAIPTTMLVRHGSAAQQERWLRSMARGERLAGFALSEPESGSDAGALATRAVRDRDGWLLSGTKAWATNGGTADLMVVMARTERGISAFIVPTDVPGYRPGRPEDKMGLRASNTVAIALEDVRLPADHLLGEDGQGFRYAMEGLDVGRLGIAVQAVGIARRAPAVRRGAAGVRGGAVQAGGHGHARGGRPRPHPRGRWSHRPERGLHDAGEHGQAVRVRDRDVGHDAGGAAVRRLRLHAGLPGREAVPGCEGHGAL